MADEPKPRTERQPLGRLAFREEDQLWCAYWAPHANSMEEAILLGSITMTVMRNPKRKRGFMDLMRGAFADTVESVIGQRPHFSRPETAPEHERSAKA